MANHASAEKRNRQRVTRTARNRSARANVRTIVKKARTAIEGGDAAKAKDPVLAASKALAKAASKGTVNKKTASRVTSRIASALSKLAR
jgi:small subunit ribosomal protein S20